jgi:TatD DNase family protein
LGQYIQMRYIDSHTHLDTLTAQPGGIAGVIARAQQANVKMVTIGTQAADWPILRGLAAEYRADVRHTVGLHPSEVTPQNWQAELHTLEDELGQGTPVALGECGLDYYRLPEDQGQARAIVEAQRAAFERQLDMARQTALPIVIHSRGAGAFADIIKTIAESKIEWPRFVFHCFSEGAAEVRWLNERGARASFTGIITFKNGEQMRQALRAQPLALTMLETDAPFLSPEPHRGEPNEPARMPLIVKKTAELMGVSLIDMAEAAYNNTIDFYKIQGW